MNISSDVLTQLNLGNGILCSWDRIGLDVETFEPVLHGRLSGTVVPKNVFDGEDPYIPTGENSAQLIHSTFSPEVTTRRDTLTFSLLHGSVSFLPIAFILARASEMSCRSGLIPCERVLESSQIPPR